ncbi:hypothetical protein [Uliginosibacterium sp. TH139]|uniref:hypothetical protein n=1 Tax=Uliginosibacterium sp. TH139 TaxID=2067453 RepID=UPI00117D625D|nr:hypothetical protein [Uliginosibacterium sp. TH139]
MSGMHQEGISCTKLDAESGKFFRLGAHFISLSRGAQKIAAVISKDILDCLFTSLQGKRLHSGFNRMETVFYCPFGGNFLKTAVLNFLSNLKQKVAFKLLKGICKHSFSVCCL